MNDILDRPAVELAGLVRDGELSAHELVEESLGRAEAVDRELGAFTWIDGDAALAAADAIGPGDARPFAGVPIAVKDIVPMAGRPLTMGSELYGDYVADVDANVIRRIKEAGFVVVGQTKVPEFGIVNVTEPRRFGPARNPWDPSRTPGGSSGGSAAAVAAGALPLAHGSDGGGSIRIPAACCGLVGLKPSRGRISSGPALGDSFLVTEGALTRTVADTAAMLDVLSGYEPGDATWAPPPPEPFAEAARREPAGLRIGVTLDAPIDAPIDPLSAEAVGDAAELLESLGHRVGDVRAPWRDSDLLPTFMKLWCVSTTLGVLHGALVTGRAPAPELVEPLTWWLYEQAQELGAPEHEVALLQLKAHARQIVAQVFGDHDVLLLPTLAKRPVRLGEIDACGENPAYEFKKSGQFTPHTALFNLTGQPAVSLPLFHGDDGLPLAVQLAGPPAGEALLLSLGAQLEAARPWAERRPAVTSAR